MVVSGLHNIGTVGLYGLHVPGQAIQHKGMQFGRSSPKIQPKTNYLNVTLYFSS